MARQYVLSIDGGGIRGIIPATALMQLEQTTGRLTRDIFSFVAGTSTGAIIAAAVAAGVPAKQIRDLYLTRAQEVFTKRPWSLLQRVIFGSMYSTSKLRALIARELGAAHLWRLNDAPIDLLITANRVEDGKAWYFVGDNPRNSQRTGHLNLIDCVTASTAEPTYFQPWTIPEDASERLPGVQSLGALVGGGVGVANNPVYQACVEAFYYTDRYQPENTTVVSLGTGRFASLGRPTWIWSWLRWVLNELLRSPHEQQTEIAQRLLPHMLLYRIDTQLTRDIPLDDIRSVEEIRQLADRFVQQIPWQAILDGTDTTFRIGANNTLWPEYSHPPQR